MSLRFCKLARTRIDDWQAIIYGWLRAIALLFGVFEQSLGQQQNLPEVLFKEEATSVERADSPVRKVNVRQFPFRAELRTVMSVCSGKYRRQRIST